MTTAKLPITESDKSRLVDHLRNVVIAGISGRDGADVIDLTPSRAIFAGVLQAPRALPSIDSSAPPPDIALGLDFRVVPEAGKPIRLRLSPRWSHYYAVFPTYGQARDANPTPTSPPASTPTPSTPEPSTATTPLPALEVALGAPDEASETEEDGEDLELIPDVTSGSLLLPRVFRRISVVPQSLSFEIADLDSSTEQDIGSLELTAALNDARQRLGNDPRVWRHLGDPGAGVRTLGDQRNLATEGVYEDALARVTGPAVAPPEWNASVQISSEPDNSIADAVRIRILLTNQTPSETVGDYGLLETAMFDAGLEVVLESGQLVPFEFLLAPKDYKSDPQMFGKGINCSAVFDASRNMVATETLPVYQQPLLKTRDELSVRFADLDITDSTATLEQIANAMNEYLAKWDGFLALDAQQTFSESELAACRADRNAFEQELEQFRLGLECLRRDPRLAKAFQFTNRVFGRLADASGGRVSAWRQFQLGFIISQLPALAARETSPTATDDFSTRVNQCLETVGVLWFPTGGGKTEAYLGLIAITLVFDRLRNKRNGVSAWMRFPLRMLSLQQLERLAKVIAALNALRSEQADLQHGDPFAIGYFVGDGVTPNSVPEEAMNRFASRPDERERLRVLRKCPYCSSRIRIDVDKTRWRVLHRCDNDSCFSNTSLTMGVYKGSLPLCITDNEIYRYLPSVLVGTVDKLAIIARSRFFTHLLSGPKQSCEVHGYTSYDECIERWAARCQASGKKLKVVATTADPVPALLIQDELHLLRSELGVFNGHYEGLLKFIGKSTSRPPKVLAATATIEAYDAQAFHLYLSRAVRFPAPSYQNGESFYATTNPVVLRRSFIGILSHTRGVEDCVNRALTLYWTEIRRLEMNPFEVAKVTGRNELSDLDCRDLLRLYDLSLVYVNRKATGGSVLTRLNRVNAVLSRASIQPLVGKLLTGDNPVEDVGITLDRIDSERTDTPDPRLNVLVATSLISHGVDLERINSMIMAGMPSRYAEYVQSTSRSARTHPGLVFVCFKGSDAREASQYEFFFPMHQHMDRLIEAVAVNRFASFAPRKTIPGLLAGLLLCDVTPKLYGTKITKPLDHLPTLQVALGYKPGGKTGTVSGCVSLDALRDNLHKIIGVDRVRPPATSAEIANTRQVIDEVFDQNMTAIARSIEDKLKNALNPILSFRDVDEGVDFGSTDSSTYVTRLRPR
ncbi:MAG: DEAD/DEAH box helicase family protein [Vicinamibacterales bacterium]